MPFARISLACFLSYLLNKLNLPVAAFDFVPTGHLYTTTMCRVTDQGMNAQRFTLKFAFSLCFHYYFFCYAGPHFVGELERVEMPDLC